MGVTLFVNPRYKEFVQRCGLDRFDRVMSWSDGCCTASHATREARRIEVNDGGNAVELYVKREWQSYLKDQLTNLFAGLGWGTKALREWHVLNAMSKAGIGCPEPVAMAQRGLARPEGYLIVRSIRDAVELKRYLAENLAARSVSGRRHP